MEAKFCRLAGTPTSVRSLASSKIQVNFMTLQNAAKFGVEVRANTTTAQ